MPNVVTNYFKTQSALGNVSLSAAGAFKLALIKDIFSTSAVDVLSDVRTFDQLSATWEVSAAGNYSAGGKILTNMSVVQDDVADRAVVSADGLTWTSSTITAYGDAVYRASDGLLVTLHQFDTAKSSSNGDFALTWTPNGIATLS